MLIHQMPQNLQESMEQKELDCVGQKECSMKKTGLNYL